MKAAWIVLLLTALSVTECFGHLNILDQSRDKRWYIVRIVGFYPPFDFQYKTTVLRLDDIHEQNDTIFSTVLETEDADYNVWYGIGNMMETNRKVYFQPNGSVSVVQLYDFNVQPSSTFNLSNPYHRETYQAIVERIDSVQYDNALRKRIHFNLFQEKWIEGIGSLQGLLHKGLGISGAKYELSCYSENGVVVYHNPDYPECFCTTGLEDPVDDGQETLTAVQGFIRLRNHRNERLRVFDLTGKLVLDLTIGMDDDIVDLTMLKKGLYLYRLTGHPATGKVLIP